MPRKPVVQGPQAVLLSADNPMAAFLEALAAQDVAASTARSYLAQLRRFEAWLADQYGAGLLEATAHDVHRYKADLVGTMRPNSVNAALAALRRFYSWAVASGRLKASPATDAKNVEEEELAPKGFDGTERRRLEREAEKAGPMADAVVTTLLHTGIRVSELVGLTWEAVFIGPRSGAVRVRGKGNKTREIPLGLSVRKALEAIRPDPAATGPVFRGKRGPYTARGIGDLLAELGRRANVQAVHPHRFRHDVARRLLVETDLATTAKVLGHRRFDSLRIYTQPSAEDLQRAVEALEKS